MSVIRVAIVDDQAMVRAGFRLLLDAEPDIDVVGEAADGREAIAVARRARPDVMLMDVRMPVLDGISATRQLLADDSACRVVVLTTFDLDEYVYGALRAGASGFLLKDAPPEQLVLGIRTVAAGDGLLAPSITRRVIERFAELPDTRSHARDPALETLTAREYEVLEHVARGRSNAEISARLFITETTTKTHVGRILAKLGLRDRVHAVVYAYEAGIVVAGNDPTTAA